MGIHAIVSDAIWNTNPRRVSAVVSRIRGPAPKIVRLLRFQSEVFGENPQIKCWWPRQPLPGNLGDLLTPIILKRLFGLSPVFSTSREFIGAGSLLNRALPGTTVWGSGILNPEEDVASGVNFLAVRGPLTRRRLKASGHAPPDVLGDPALLMPRIYNPPSKPPSYRIGYIPHYSHEKFEATTTSDTLRIEILRGSIREILRFIDEIRECETIVSTSLHGIILAAAYGKPIVWLKLKQAGLKGGDFKFEDFFQSIGRGDVRPRSVSTPGELYRLGPGDATLVEIRPSISEGLIDVFKESQYTRHSGAGIS